MHANRHPSPARPVHGPSTLVGLAQIKTAEFVVDSVSPATGFPYISPSPVANENVRSASTWFGDDQGQAYGASSHLPQFSPDESSFMTGGDFNLPLVLDVNVLSSVGASGADGSPVQSRISPPSTIDSASPSFGFHFSPHYNYRRCPDFHSQEPPLTTTLLLCGCTAVYHSETGTFLGVLPGNGSQESSSSYSSPQSPLSGAMGALSVLSPTDPNTG